MGKLHELLAVEGELAGRVNFKELKDLFAQPQKFLGQVRTYRPLEENGKTQPDEITNLSTTVDSEVRLLLQALSDWMDASVQKEVTNQSTKATIIINGQAIDLPAPALLNLESKLANLRSLLEAIPVNDTTERWEWDEQSNSYISAPRTTYRTEKEPRSIIGAPATDKHPAQVQWFSEDVRVGEWTTTIRSGMLAPSDKRDVLRRLDTVIAEVKRGRQRANDVEVTDIKIAKVLLDYIWE